jgi:hypothetical protein
MISGSNCLQRPLLNTNPMAIGCRGCGSWLGSGSDDECCNLTREKPKKRRSPTTNRKSKNAQKNPVGIYRKTCRICGEQDPKEPHCKQGGEIGRWVSLNAGPK